MSSNPRTFIRNTFFAMASMLACAAVLFVSAVAFRMVSIPDSVDASSMVFYPKFCLGGWDHPQLASGNPQISYDAISSEYSDVNSARLSAGVSSSIFCGYFSEEDKTNKPSKVKILFNWSMTGGSSVPANSSETIDSSSSPAQQSSHSSDSGFLIATSTGFEVPVEIATTTEIINTPMPDPETDTDPEPATELSPVSEPTPAAAEPAPSEPVSFLKDFIYSLVNQVYAEDSALHSNNPLFEVSYSVDGTRWVSVGTVGVDNWKGYSVAVPVLTWGELNRLQIMVSPLPSLDSRPDIYMESMAASVDYEQTLAESSSDALANVANAVDTVADALLSVVTPQIAPVPEVKQPIFVTKKQLAFSIDKYKNEIPDNIKVHKSADDSSLEIYGSCQKKYFVVLMYKNQTDAEKKPGSFVANEARECDNGSVFYDLASISPDIRSGVYYVSLAEEEETGPWSIISGPFPIGIEATTTVEEIIQ